MYLISLYFDQDSTRRIQCLIEHVANVTHQYFMLDHHVPPHLTLLSFDTKNVEEVIQCFNEITIDDLTLNMISIGALVSKVVYISCLYTQELFDLQNHLYNDLSKITDLHFSQYYKPFNYLPHITISKQLNQEQIEEALSVLVNEFTPFLGKVVRIELSNIHPFSIVASKNF